MTHPCSAHGQVGAASAAVQAFVQEHLHDTSGGLTIPKAFKTIASQDTSKCSCHKLTRRTHFILIPEYPESAVHDQGPIAMMSLEIINLDVNGTLVVAIQKESVRSGSQRDLVQADNQGFRCRALFKAFKKVGLDAMQLCSSGSRYQDLPW